MRLRILSPHLPGAAFTLVEFLITVGIAVLLVAGVSVFMQATGVQMAGVTSQSAYNQESGHAAEVLQRRIRLANSARTEAAGDTLVLSFDDDPDVDSNGDTTVWNDQDHFERIEFVTGDGNAGTLEDNQLVLRSTAGGDPETLLPTGVRRLPGVPVFVVTNRTTVLINLGLLHTNRTARSEAVELRTEARLRNRTK